MEYHYFASSINTWETSQDIGALCERMKKNDPKRTLGFTVWLVPESIDGSYEIDEYQPQVKGALRLFRHMSQNETSVPSMPLEELTLV